MTEPMPTIACSYVSYITIREYFAAMALSQIASSCHINEYNLDKNSILLNIIKEANLAVQYADSLIDALNGRKP